MDFTKVTRFLNGVKRTGVKYAPEIMIVGGIVLTGVSLWQMRKAALKEDEVRIRHQERMNNIWDKAVKAETGEIKYNEKEHKEETVAAYGKTAIDYITLYGPPVAAALGAVGLVLASNKIRRDRYMGLAAAYATLSSTFNTYQNRVIADAGMAKHLLYKNGVKKEIVVDTDENGKDSAKEIDILDDSVEEFSGEYSCYSKIFDETNNNWNPDPESNRFFLQTNEDTANKVCKGRGYLFLNEVYEALGIPKTKAGQIVGWIWDERRGDHQIDFGMFNVMRPKTIDFVNGYEPSVILDFNVDGPIIENVLMENT